MSLLEKFGAACIVVVSVCCVLNVMFITWFAFTMLLVK